MVCASPYQPVAPGKAMIKLSVGNLSMDGTGYRIFLDSTHSLYGMTMPVVGSLTSGGDVPASIYDQFTYKIPGNADGVLRTENIAGNNKPIYIIVDAEIYDFCITNPTAGARIWIVNSAGEAFGRCDNFVVDKGYIYDFCVLLRNPTDFVSVKELRRNGR
ncbi:MAG: DUF2436 domain-containing protein [Clostridia bacterium]